MTGEKYIGYLESQIVNILFTAHRAVTVFDEIPRLENETLSWAEVRRRMVHHPQGWHCGRLHGRLRYVHPHPDLADTSVPCSLSRCSITANCTRLIPVKSDSPARINILLKYAFTVRRDIFSSLAISA